VGNNFASRFYNDDAFLSFSARNGLNKGPDILSDREIDGRVSRTPPHFSAVIGFKACSSIRMPSFAGEG
jgi:hypothetical protein